MEDFNRQTVPKFSTFRPKLPKTPELLIPSSKEQRKSKKTLREDRESRSRGYGDRDQPQVHKSKDNGQASSAHYKSMSEASTDRVFISDKRGDQDNVRYGSIHHYAVPKYNRIGSGSVLGADPAWKIDRSNPTDKFLCLRLKDSRGTRMLKSLRKIGKDDEIRIRPHARDSLADLTKDYLLLDERSRKPMHEDERDFRSASESSDVGTDDASGNVSILGQALVTDQSTDLLADASHSHKINSDSTSNESDISNKRSSFSQKLRDDPGDARAWLNLIQLESISQIRQNAGQRINFSMRRSQADIKTSLYEKALKAVKSPEFIEILTSGLLGEARFLWDERRMRKKWDETLSKHNFSSLLWVQHLDFMQSSATKFKFDDVQELFVKYFAMLGQSRANSALLRHAEEAAYALLKITVLLQSAGFTERAIAIWQANLEWHFRKPTSGGTPSNDPQDSGTNLQRVFEAFWDSESVRIGEICACRWDTSIEQDKNLLVSSIQPVALRQSGSLTVCGWGDNEERLSSECPLPARTTDDLGEEDPYRLVLFSDIECYILPFSKPHRSLLIDAFLAFCCLPPLPVASQNRIWQGDAFVCDPSTNDPVLNQEVSEHSKFSEDQSEVQIDTSRSMPFKMAVQAYLVTLDVLFPNPRMWFSAFETWTSQAQKPKSAVMCNWTQRILEALAETESVETEYLEYYVAFILQLSPNKARKVAKALLKSQQSNIRLYNVYALVEYRLGKMDKAQATLCTAIQMFKHSSDTVLLRRTLIWETMELRGTQAALSQLLCTSGTGSSKPKPEEIDASAILSLQKELLASRDFALSSKAFVQALANIDLLILLTYLTHPSPLQAALAIFTTNTTLLSTTHPTTTPYHESLHQSLARLLYHHVTISNSFQPSLLRSFLASSIRLFPQNTIFLSLYAWNEARSRINDRVRAVVRDILDPLTVNSTDDQERNTPSSSSLITHLFAIHTELTRSTVLGSNANTVRAAFEAALTPYPYAIPSLGNSGIDYTPHSPLLWRQYFHFEISRGDLKRAKDVFYRAITACPWVKGLYLLAFRYLEDVMSSEELRGVYELMEERELRIRVPYPSLEERVRS